VDVTPAGDTPKCKRQSVKLGKGPAIKVMDASVVVPPRVRRLLQGCAEQAGIPFQTEVLTAGGTDTGAISRTAAGIAAGCISIPARYLHTPVETCDLGDARGCAALLKRMMEAEL
jgi:endoglucanase